MTDTNAQDGASPSPVVATTASEKREPVGVGGWLIFLCIILVVIQPCLTIFELVDDGHTLYPLFTFYPSVKVAFIFSVAISTIVMGFGFYAGICLWTMRNNAVFIAKSYFVTNLILTILAPILTSAIPDLPKEVGSAVVIEGVKEIVRTLIALGIWFSYLSVSRRVANTYDPQTRLALMAASIPTQSQTSRVVEEAFRASAAPLPDDMAFTDALNELSAASVRILESVRESSAYSTRAGATTISIFRYGTLVKACHTNGEVQQFGAQYNLGG